MAAGIPEAVAKDIWDWAKIHWSHLEHGQKVAVVIIGAVLGAVATGVVLWWKLRKPGKRHEPAITIHGHGQVALGDHNVQHQTVLVAPRRREIAAEMVAELINGLRSLPPHTFDVITGMDNDSHAIGIAISSALSRAGWSYLDSFPTAPGDFTPGSAPIGAVTRKMPSPSRSGVTVYCKVAPSDSVGALAAWCRKSGLQPGIAMGTGLPANRPPDVVIEVGEAP